MANAIGYARISVEDKRSKGVSIEAQQVAIETYCALRELTLIGVLTDEGVSAATPLVSRPKGGLVIAAVDAREAQHVVAYKLDRLFRNALDCLGVVKAWDKAGVALHLVSQGGTALDTTSTMGKFFLTLLAGVAEMERGMISERTSAALQHKRSLGQVVGAVPYGFTSEIRGEGRDAKRWLVENPAEQEVIARIVRDVASGKSLRAVAHGLDVDGIPPRGTRRKDRAQARQPRWQVTAIVRILANWKAP